MGRGGGEMKIINEDQKTWHVVRHEERTVVVSHSDDPHEYRLLKDDRLVLVLGDDIRVYPVGQIRSDRRVGESMGLSENLVVVPNTRDGDPRVL